MNKSNVFMTIGCCVLLGGIAWVLGDFLAGGKTNYEAGPDAIATPAVPAPASTTDQSESSPADRGAPPRSAIPDNDFGDLVRKGEQIFNNPKQYASAYVGNDLSCKSCHFDAGRYEKTAPLRAAWPMYPAYRSKNGHVNDFAERLQGCFIYSMNGKAPPRGGEVLRALESYSFWLAQGTRAGVKLDSKGFPEIAPPEQAPSFERGKEVFADSCALCHGADGAGQVANDGSDGFPPLWGARSYNWGAGMHKVETAASFIKVAMPLSKPVLSDQQAWDVALFINSHERPQDPRFNGSVSETAEQFHQHDYAKYGKEGAHGKVLGASSPPSGTVP